MRFGKLILTGTLCLSLAACASYDFSRRVAQQGNLLPQEKIARLHIGMSRQDVAVLMGNSLLSPTFNNNRWDYAFTLRKGSSPLEVRNLSLFFTGDRLSAIEHRP